jgi:hypothetical protein
MNRLLIYIGKDQKFDVGETIAAICTIPGVSNSREGTLTALFECEYEALGRFTTIRISSNAEVVTAEGLGDDAVQFMLELQSRLPIDLYVTDMGYDFDLPVRSFATIEEFNCAADAGLRLCPWD